MSQNILFRKNILLLQEKQYISLYERKPTPNDTIVTFSNKVIIAFVKE